MHYSLNQSRQHGTALLISMIILLVMSLIILQGARSANLEILIGNNTLHTAEALMQAEDSAVAGEKMLDLNYAGAPTGNYGGNDDDGVFLVGQIDINTVDWDAFQTQSETGYDGSHREYLVEYVGPESATGGSLSVGAGAASDTRYIYRVSGRGVAGNGGARVVQTIYAMAE
jgi:Tfp pilus assembly protein PilX